MKVFSDKRLLKKCSIASAICLILILVFYWASGDRLYFEEWHSDIPDAQEQITVLHEGSIINYPIYDTCDSMYSLSLYIADAIDRSKGSLVFNLATESGAEIGNYVVPASELPEFDYYTLYLKEPYEMDKEDPLHITITTDGITEDQVIALWGSNSFTTGKYTLSDMNSFEFTVDGVSHSGKVCSYIYGRNNYLIGKIFWPCAIALFVAFTFYIFNLANRYVEGNNSWDIRAYINCNRYKFLMKQLVSRDFKKKYKRSVLGFGWTILNPLLTMLVQYVVFSTIFKSSIENFVTYLLTGIVLMNFFYESIGLGLSSIIDNAHLINKVYMPKEIYPLSRVISSVINLVLAMIPLLVVAICSGSPISKAMLLIPIDLLLLLIFCYGMVLILSTSMAMFSDTLFLWNVLSTLWMYLTPIFYPISIIPLRFLAIYKLNPMYQFITFMRSILIFGEAPSPANYLGCIVSSVVLLIVGRIIFKKNEDKFILYL